MFLEVLFDDSLFRVFSLPATIITPLALDLRVSPFRSTLSSMS